MRIIKDGLHYPAEAFRSFHPNVAFVGDVPPVAYSEAMRPISAAYPPEEREGWAEQVAAAQEVVTGGQNDLIDALRHPTGETALEMAQRIIAKRAEYLVSYGQVTAARRGVEAQIEAANTLADLEAIDVRAAFGLG